MLESTKNTISLVETGRLKMCEIDGHLREFEKILTDERTMRLYPQFKTNPKLSIERLLGFLDAAGIYIYPFKLKENDTVIGFVTVNNVVESCKRIEVGYFLLSDFWNNGYAREILRAVTDCLKLQGWHRIEATVYSGNEASEKVLRSCGFVLEGVLRDKYIINGEYHDDLVYSVIEPNN